ATFGFLSTAKGPASVLVPIGSALAAGKAFDFRSDLLLLSGGALAVFAHFVGPVVLRLRISRKLHNALLYIGLCLVTYGIFLTVVPTAWTPFAAKFTLPKIGWAGVFTLAIVFDTVAAVLAWFVLRRMKLPSHVPHVSYAPHPKVVVQAGLERWGRVLRHGDQALGRAAEEDGLGARGSSPRGRAG